MSELTLQKIKIDHAKKIYELTNKNRSYLREWLPWLDTIQEISDTKNFINSVSDDKARAPHYAVTYNGSVCGVAGFHRLNIQNNIGELGYWLCKDFNGNGIITRAVVELMKIGFTEYNLNKIEIRCAENNLKSRAIPERLGFTYEATLRECEWLYTKYVDHAVYSMLASEFNA